MRIGDHPRIELRNRLVVEAVKDEHRPLTDGVEVAETLRSSGGSDRREFGLPEIRIGRKVDVGDRSGLTGVSQQAIGFLRPVVEIGRRADERCAGDSGALAFARLDALHRCGQPNRSPGTEAHHPDLVAGIEGGEMVEGTASVVDPAAETEVAVGLATAPESERERGPTHLLGHAIGELGQISADVGRDDEAGWKAVKQQNTRRLALRRRDREVGVQPPLGTVDPTGFGQGLYPSSESASTPVPAPAAGPV